MRVFSDQVMETTAHWLSVFAAEWHAEMPRQLHSHEVDPGGAPQWHPEFARWLTRHDAPEGSYQRRNPDGRLRLTRAMRYLRKVAVREYEVLYRTMALGLSIESTTQWLNERSIRGGHPERYTKGDTLALVQSAVHKVSHWY